MFVLSPGVLQTGCQVGQHDFSRLSRHPYDRTGSGLSLSSTLSPPAALPCPFCPVFWPRYPACSLRPDGHNIPSQDEKSRCGHFSNIQGDISPGFDEGKDKKKMKNTAFLL